MGDRPDHHRQELQNALDAVTTSFAVGRPVSPVSAAPSPAPSVPAAGKVELASAYDKRVAHDAAKPAFSIPPLPAKWKRYLKPAIIVASVTVAIWPGSIPRLPPRMIPARKQPLNTCWWRPPCWWICTSRSPVTSPPR